MLSTERQTQPAPTEIVLLDMDGTLLDLGYDDNFWNHFLPQAFAQRRDISLLAAHQFVERTLASVRGTLTWYDIHHWSRVFEIDILSLKAEYAGPIQYRPGSLEFLESLKSEGIRTVLATNAHPDLIDLKVSALDAQALPFADFFDEILSSHAFGQPKESMDYWHAIQDTLAFEPSRALFVDDNLDVLKVAQAFGIGQCVAVSQPDISRPIREIDEFPSVNRLTNLVVPR